MAVNDELYGSTGASGVLHSVPFGKIGRVFDFEKCNIKITTEYSVLALPKNFVLLGISVEEVEKLVTSDSAVATITVKDTSLEPVSFGTVANLGGNLSDPKAIPAKVFGYLRADDATNKNFYKDGVKITISSNKAISGGKLSVSAIGYLASGGSELELGKDAPAFVTPLQTDFNVAGGDPLYTKTTVSA